jgi:hypothetical protein
MMLSRRHLLGAAAVSAAAVALPPVTGWAKTREAGIEVLVLADPALGAAFDDAVMVRGPAQLDQAARWLAKAPRRALAGLLSDADGILLRQMVERGQARWLWADHHVLAGPPSASWRQAMAQSLSRLERGPAASSQPGPASAYLSFAALGGHA